MRDLTQGDVNKNLISLAWPMIVGILAVMGFNIVDTYFVGLLGTTELAAMSFTFPVAMMVSSIGIGLSIGMSSLVSRSVGSGDMSRIRGVVTDGLIFSVFIVVVLSILGISTMDIVFKAMGADGETLVLVKRYMSIWYFNIVFVVVPMVGNGAIRASGDTRTPMIIMSIAGLVNVILDPILIFGWGPFPRLELEGAAYATVASRATTLVAALYFLHFREGFLRKPFGDLKETWKHFKEVAQVAIPAGMGHAINPVSTFIVTAMIAIYGDAVVAGFGVGTRLETLFCIIIYGLSAGLAPFVGQNFGGLKKQRILQSIRSANLFSIGWVVVSLVFMVLLGDRLIEAFSNDSVVHDITESYIFIVLPSLIPFAVMHNINSSFNAMGRSTVSLIISFLRMIVIYVPLALVLRESFGHKGVFYAAAISNVIAGVVAWYLFRKLYINKKEFSEVRIASD
ncbi:MAG: MATE family efflux transporter [Bdellovibrionaceae bacterium]|nr:MATE family efflux transporter [Pseudobdellovibrionaceae bacterium]|tara:strand:- start:150621 stop:151979 length:1359 start_codon:yes stop_codon:yes gene_type:complete